MVAQGISTPRRDPARRPADQRAGSPPWRLHLPGAPGFKFEGTASSARVRAHDAHKEMPSKLLEQKRLRKEQVVQSSAVYKRKQSEEVSTMSLIST